MEKNRKYTKELEGLLLRGRKWMEKNYPKFEPRETDEGHFELYLRQQLVKDAYDVWHRKVLDIVEFGLGDAYSAAKLHKAKPSPSLKNAYAPDRFYYSLIALEEVIEDLRLMDGISKERLGDDDRVVVHLEYIKPSLVLVTGKTSYILHVFRKGKPQRVLEYAINKPDSTARRSEFRSGGLANITIPDNFKTLFKNLLVDQPRQSFLWDLITITDNKLAIDRQSRVVLRGELNQTIRDLKILG